MRGPAILGGSLMSRQRESAFADSIAGRRFSVTHQTPGTAVLGQTAFVATTPTFLLRNASATTRVVLRSITLTQVDPVAGAEPNILLAIDTADRLSSGGTAVTPQNMNTEVSIASLVTGFLFNPTATAAGAGTRYINPSGAPATLGTVSQIDLKDGIVLGTTGSILVYTWADTTGPSWFFNFEWAEIPTG